MNYKLTIQYDGSRYDGWQKQGNTQNTIQGKLESVLSRIAGEPVELHGAGRTDAGVHALSQIANVHLPDTFSADFLMTQINRYLPEDIAVTSVEKAAPRFHARLNARAKTYRYSIRLGSVPDVFRRKYQYRLDESLDISAMEKAAGFLCGEHDFRAFCSGKTGKRSTVREIYSIEICCQPGELFITYRGNGFLYNMVRILTGTLIEVGAGKLAAEEIPLILSSRDRAKAGFTAPAQGLCLLSVEY